MKWRDAERELVEIQDPVARNELDPGPAADEWRTVRRVDAYIHDMRGSELAEANSVHSSTTHRIQTRRFEGANARQRIKAGERIFQIVSVVRRRHKFLEFICASTEAA